MTDRTHYTTFEERCETPDSGRYRHRAWTQVVEPECPHHEEQEVISDETGEVIVITCLVCENWDELTRSQVFGHYETGEPYVKRDIDTTFDLHSRQYHD